MAHAVLLQPPPPRRPFRPRGGSGVEYFELAVCRAPPPPHAVDAPLHLGAEPAATTAALLLAARGLLPLESWVWVHRELGEAARLAQRHLSRRVWALLAAALVGLAVGGGLQAAATALARSEYRADRAGSDDDDDFDSAADTPRYAPGLYGASLALLIAGAAVALAGVPLACARSRGELERRLGAAEEAVALHVATASGGRLAARLLMERVESYLQAEGSAGSVVVVPREARALRLELLGGGGGEEPPLHGGMTLGTHGYLPGMPGYLLGGDLRPVAAPPPKAQGGERVLVSPLDYMASANEP